MSDLCGAWSLSGEPIAELLRESDKQSMAKRLTFIGDEKRTEFTHQTLWLTATAGKIVHDESRCLAMEGFVAFGDKGSKGLAEIFAEKKDNAGWDPKVEGHYVLVYADPAKNLLQFYRDPTGGARLLYLRVGPLLLFSTTAKALLAHSRVAIRLNEEIAEERMLTEIAAFGHQTLWDGIEEVLPGHRLSLQEGKFSHRWLWGDLLKGCEGSPEELAPQFMTRLRSAVGSAIGKDRQAAVALSGGIDSAAITAVAAEWVGAENVHAFTYDFDDPAHITETGYASLVCRKLGIKNHHIIRLSPQKCVDELPASVWHHEDLLHYVKAHVAPFARRIAEMGFPKHITGYGIGGSMAYIEDFAEVLPRLPWPGGLFHLWKYSLFKGWSSINRLALLHPGLELPKQLPCLYYPLLCILRHNGIIRDVARFYPRSMRKMAARASESARVRDAIAEVRHLPLAAQMQYLALTHCNMMVDVYRIERLSQNMGSQRISPSFFPSCLPLAMFHPIPKASLFNEDRRIRPGKPLLRRALRGVLPDEVLDRPKIWSQAVVPSPEIYIRRTAKILLPTIEQRLKPSYLEDIRKVKFQHRGIINLFKLALWHRIFIERPIADQPPTWDDISV